ncbi:MAG: vWA domain-containing protein, partial [Pseudomonadota bacterium]
VRADAVVEWKQNIVAAFTNPAGRERQLLFESKEALDTLLNLQAPVSTAQAYREAAVAAAAQAAEDASVSIEPSEGGVVSVEPEVHIDVEQEFYILPILDWLDELHPQSVEPYLQLKVASLPLQEAEENETGGIVNYQAGIVFLIDTTQSMQPYIDEAAEAMAALVQQIRANELGSRINFGVYGFRDNPAAADGIEYRVKEYLPLERREDQQPVVDTLRAMEVARVNTPGFNEDSIAAVDKALRDIPWTDRGFGGKYIILLTDAGPKAPGDVNALLEDNAEGINSFATTSAGASILTIHLQTQEGRANHAYAEREYRKLSRFGQDVLYYPIEEGDAASYSAQVNSIAEFVTSAVEDAMNGELANPDEAETEEEAALARVTLAMQLAFLGETEGGGAPDLFEAWTADASIEDASIVALEPRLLITKNELSTLSDVVQAAISAGEDTRSGGNAGDFFDQLQGAMARMSQNPDVLTNSEFETLGEAFGEFMERLPYRSRD